MTVVGLPGVKAATLPWLQNLLSALGDDFAAADILQYRHWSQAVDADAEYEAGRLQQQTPDLVIAKSLGTFIATLAFDRFVFRPRRAVLVGVPIQRHRADNFARLGKFVAGVETLFIQQSEDVNGSYRELCEILPAPAAAGIIEVPGSDHVYADIECLRDIVQTKLLHRDA